jgi:hypothetical protein
VRLGTWLAVGLLLLALGCASGGRRFNADAVPSIQRGRWTQQDVQSRFGQPTGVQVRGSGNQVWTYRFTERSSVDTGTVSRIATFVAALFGNPIPSAPVNVRTSNSTRYSLDVEFDSEGVVQDYTYSRQSDPSSEVY